MKSLHLITSIIAMLSVVRTPSVLGAGHRDDTVEAQNTKETPTDTHPPIDYENARPMPLPSAPFQSTPPYELGVPKSSAPLTDGKEKTIRHHSPGDIGNGFQQPEILIPQKH